MEFLVQIVVNLPPDMDSTERADLLERERRKAEQLRATGVIKRIWRIPGRSANVGVWEAADPTELHDAITSLPLFPWLAVEVTGLATHYLEAGAAGA
jgi:muconolactone D-isomerase